MALKDSIAKYMDAGYPMFYINTFEESKTESMLKSIADGRRVAIWSIAGGYSEYDTKNNEYLISQNKDDAFELQNVLERKLCDENELNRSILIIKDAHIVLENEEVKAALKEIAVKISEGLDSCVVLISSVVTIPVELEKYITILENDYLGFGEIRDIIKGFAEDNGINALNPTLLDELAVALKGLSEYEILNFLSLALADDGELTRKDLSLIFEQKKQMILKSGTLEMISLNESINDIGGLENLKKWLIRKSAIITNIPAAEEFGVDMPKGVLIAGVPGCGKSLCAKATAKLFEIPLLRLDIGKLMGKYLGESEANFRKAINLAEAISPCVLWVDELEKAFAGIGGDGGHEVTTRLFGSFLTWMQEKTSAVFVVATANDITKLPPELLRKGRFDEIFYVGLPNNSERAKIFDIHIKKRRKNAKIDISRLVSKTDGYSGADIEGVVKEAVESAFANKKDELSTEDILDAIKNTNSLSVIMKDSLDRMKKEYENRKLKNASA